MDTTSERGSPQPALSQSIIQDHRIRLLAGFVMAALSLAVFYLLATGALSGWKESADQTVRSKVTGLGTPALTSMFLVFTELGSTLYLTVIGVIAGISFLFLGWMRELGLFLVSMVGQIVLHHGSKAIFRAGRPAPLFDYPDVAGYSFPSGHALASFCVYVVLAGLIVPHVRNRAARTSIWLFAAVLVLLIGLSRVYLGMHYLSDVMAGYLAAIIWSAAVLFERNPTKQSVVKS
jgi:undecaprenyl-diphosphatase